MQSNRVTRFLFLITLMAGCNRDVREAVPVSQPRERSVTASDAGRAIERSFGERQLDQMLQDRPDMQGIMPESHPVFRWLVDSFNGDRIGQRVYWNAVSPQSGRPAEHAPAYAHYPPFIAISGGTETTPIDKWASVVFEMHNLENSSEFEATSRSAVEGKLDADAFAEKCVELEFNALEKTMVFFRENPLPKSKHGKDVWYIWVTSRLGTFEEYRDAFDIPGTHKSNSNFAYFKEYYNTRIAPYADAMQRSNP